MIPEIWASFRRLPGWVQVWVAFVLVPVNLMPLAFWACGAQHWGEIAFLSVGGMALNLPILLYERGFSKAMAFPHIIFWTPLICLVGVFLVWPAEIDTMFAVALWILFLTDFVSLGFDYVDAVKWWRGDRAVA